MLFPTCWAFVRRSSSNIKGVMAILKFDLFFLPRDLVIWPLAYKNYRVLCCGRLHMWTMFGDDWSKTTTFIAENVTISFKDEYRRPTLTSRCHVISDVINIKRTFLGSISDGLSISNVKMNLSKIFRNFSNWPPFWDQGELLNRKLYRKLMMPWW